MGNTYSVRLENVVKNNQVSYRAIVITKPDIRIAPTIYLESYYEEYVAGKNITDISLAIVVQYEMANKDIGIDIDMIMNYEAIKDHLFVKVINTKLNDHKLQSIPHMDYYDLSMVVYAEMSDNEHCSASMLVQNQHLQIWNINTEELFKCAIKNTRANRTYMLRKMSDVLLRLLKERMEACEYKEGDDTELDEMIAEARKVIEDSKKREMYVLTNKQAYCGAVYMLFEDVMKEIVEEINDDVFILPCSIHEVILVPKGACSDEQELRNMVQAVNRNDMDPREVLSDEVYLYEKGNGIVI